MVVLVQQVQESGPLVSYILSEEYCTPRLESARLAVSMPMCRAFAFLEQDTAHLVHIINVLHTLSMPIQHS